MSWNDKAPPQQKCCIMINDGALCRKQAQLATAASDLWWWETQTDKQADISIAWSRPLWAGWTTTLSSVVLAMSGEKNKYSYVEEEDRKSLEALRSSQSIVEGLFFYISAQLSYCRAPRGNTCIWFDAWEGSVTERRTPPQCSLSGWSGCRGAAEAGAAVRSTVATAEGQHSFAQSYQ